MPKPQNSKGFLNEKFNNLFISNIDSPLTMNIASKNLMYEEAARIRDRIKSINQIQKYISRINLINT